MKKLILILLSAVLIGSIGCAEAKPQAKSKTVDEKKQVKKVKKVKHKHKKITNKKKIKNGAKVKVKTRKKLKSKQKAETTGKEKVKKGQKRVSYSPQKIVKLAILKCEKAGMVTTEHNLSDNLNAGKITKEEYDEYYPLDGLDDSYFSIFINTDLNKAATTSGKRLKSRDAIAQYIADMLILEQRQVFNIKYTGITKTSSEKFYEFRCYR